MTAIVYQIRDFHLKKLERDAQTILSQVLDYSGIARIGGPIIEGAISVTDPWAGRHCPGGIDDLVS